MQLSSFDWNAIEAKPTKVGEVRTFFVRLPPHWMNWNATSLHEIREKHRILRTNIRKRKSSLQKKKW
jgi:hypothetical protein